MRKCESSVDDNARQPDIFTLLQIFARFILFRHFFSSSSIFFYCPRFANTMAMETCAVAKTRLCILFCLWNRWLLLPRNKCYYCLPNTISANISFVRSHSDSRTHTMARSFARSFAPSRVHALLSLIPVLLVMLNTMSTDAFDTKQWNQPTGFYEFRF